MPRTPYHIHRAQKAAREGTVDGSGSGYGSGSGQGRRDRHGSVIESETDLDAESIFSNTTYQSSSFSPHLHPRSLSNTHSHSTSYSSSPNYHPYAHPLPYRTISSTSYGSSYPSSPGAQPRPEVKVTPAGAPSASALAGKRNGDERDLRSRNRSDSPSLSSSISPSPFGSASPGYAPGGLGLDSGHERKPSFSSFPPQEMALTHGQIHTHRQSSSSAQISASVSTSASTSRVTHLLPPSTDREARRAERRARRLREREERSTLSGGNYASPLRLWIRYMSQKEWARAILPLSLTFVGIAKLGWWFILLESTKQNTKRDEIGTVNEMGTGIGGWLRDGQGSNWKKRLMGEVVWAYAVIQWVTREGEKGGRSWRSQVIGIVTILLSPLSLFAGNPIMFIAFVLVALNLLARGKDQSAIYSVAIAVWQSTDTWTWPYVLGLGAYMAGKSLWLGGSDGTAHLTTCMHVGLLMIGQVQSMCHLYRGDFGNPLKGTIAYFPQTLRGLMIGGWSRLSTMLGQLPMRLDPADFCERATRWLPMTSIQMWTAVREHKFLAFIVLLASLPPLSILMYSNLSLRPSSPSTAISPGRRPTPSPTINLLPLILSLLSIPPFVFCPTSGNLLLVVMPLTLLMALRGGAVRGSEMGGGGAEEELWMVGMGINTLSVVALVPLSSGFLAVAMSSLLAMMWSISIGANWISLTPLLFRPVYQLLLPIATKHLRMDRIAVPEIPLLIVASGALWFWGMKKLIENAWAMGGLSGTGRKGAVEKKEGEAPREEKLE